MWQSRNQSLQHSHLGKLQGGFLKSQEYSKTWSSHSTLKRKVYINLKTYHKCSYQLYLQQPETINNLNLLPQAEKCDTSIHELLLSNKKELLTHATRTNLRTVFSK